MTHKTASKKAMKKAGVNIKDDAAVAAYLDEKRRESEAAALAKAEAERLEREANPTELDIMKRIAELLDNK